MTIALVLGAGSSQPASSAVLAATATDLSSGDFHSCAVLSDGTVQCWGGNFYGALGDGTTTDRFAPVTVSGIATATQVSAGHWHSCVRLADSTVRCWGYNLNGELGDGTTTNRPTPVAVSGISTATQVAAGGDHSCARLSDSTVKCWGSNGSGQLGNGTTIDSLTPVAVSGISTATDVSVGGSHSCARLSNSTIKCWGYNGDGELGDGTTTTRPTAVTVSGISTATQVSAGAFHTCARLSNSTVRCWGSNGFGQLGDGTTTNRSSSVAVSGISTAAQVAAGLEHSCARLSDSTLRCWGHNDYGQLGDGSKTDRLAPVSVSSVSTAAQVDGGKQHSCARLSDGTLRCWGDNLNGQLGDGTVLTQSTPVSVTGISSATQISRGLGHACARLSDSTIKCWGSNDSGQLGDGTTTDRATAVTVSGISMATQVSAGFNHTCAALSDGTVKCWGHNDTGKLGDGTLTDRSTPVSVSGITTATQVSAGRYHTCARLSDSTLKCWGWNGEGALGDGTRTDHSTPVSVSGITTATQVAAGGAHSCARLSDSTLKCWGNNYNGELGDGTTADRLTPVPVSGITMATQVSAGSEFGSAEHTCARLSDGTPMCWGDNYYFQLGDGSQTDRWTPGSVPGLTGATEISAGVQGSCSLLSGGTLKCWGQNDYGQLGDGTTTDRSTPVSISGISTATQVATSWTSACARLSDSTVKCWGYAYGGSLGNGVLGYSLVPVTVALGGGGGPQPPTITTTSLSGGTARQAYSQSVTATGGTTPYSWSVSTGTLPPGLALSPSGTPSATISGTPTSAGTYNFTIRVTDGASAADTQDLSIIVAPPPAPVPNPALLDNFNRPNENPVSQSGGWASAGIDGGAAARVSSNSLRSFPSPAGGYSYRVMPYLGGDMEAAVTVTTRPSTNHWLSVFICLQQPGTPGWDGYELRAKVLSGPDLWEVRRVDNGVPTTLASANFEITAGGTMLLRRWDLGLQFWWKASGGAWTQQLVGDLALNDSAYRWGMIGTGGYSTGVLDNFSGGSLLSLLQQFAPQLRVTNDEVYRSVDAAIATDLYFPDPNHSNLLKRVGNTTLAAADPGYPEDNLSLAYLSSYPAQPGDFLDQPNYSGDPILSAATDYSYWVTDANRQSYNRKVYGRRLTSGGETLLQYWIFYYYNPKDPGGIGKHEGDWELTQVRLSQLGVPTALTYAQHGGPEKCLWGSNVEVSPSGHPIAYVAHESHASYFWAGSHSAPVTPDITRDDGQLYYEVPDVVDVSTPPSWILWDGRWGGSDWAGIESPKSPGQQDPWKSPWTWDQSAGCSLRPPALAWRATGTELQELGSVPPLPKSVKARIVVGTKFGRAVRVSYCFSSLPSQPARRPERLHITVDNLRDGFPPLSKGWDVRKRCATVIHPVGGIKPPYVLRYSVESRRGTWSKQVTKALR